MLEKITLKMITDKLINYIQKLIEDNISSIENLDLKLSRVRIEKDIISARIQIDFSLNKEELKFWNNKKHQTKTSRATKNKRKKDL